MEHPRLGNLRDASPSSSIIWGCGTSMQALAAMASEMAPANRSLLVMGEQKIEHCALNIATCGNLRTVLQELQLVGTHNVFQGKLGLHRLRKLLRAPPSGKQNVR
jgi:hypothetical protein